MGKRTNIFEVSHFFINPLLQQLREEIASQPQEIKDQFEKDWEKQSQNNSIERFLFLVETISQYDNDNRPICQKAVDKFGILNTGSLGMAAISSKDVLGATKMVEKYQRYIFPLMDLSVEEKDDLVIVTIRTKYTSPITDMHISESVMGLMSQISDVADREVIPEEVRFKHSLSENRTNEDYESFLGCPVSFDNPDNQVLMTRETALIPLRTHNSYLLDQAKSVIPDVVTEFPPFAMETYKKLKESIEKGQKVTLDIIADRMNLSPRSVERKLKSADIKFRDLTQEVKMDLANTWINEENQSIKKVAQKLGYADSSSFLRAFKRWESEN